VNLANHVVLSFESADKILKCGRSMKAAEWNFPLSLFAMLYRVVPTFELVNEILMCNNPNDS